MIKLAGYNKPLLQVEIIKNYPCLFKPSKNIKYETNKIADTGYGAY